MKKLPLLMSAVVALSSISTTAFAEEAVAANPAPSTPEREVAYTIIPADEATGQVELGYTDSTTILEVDGLKFKDLNKNGSLDTYEDWRVDTEERITDLISQMDVNYKTRQMFHVNTCGDAGGVDLSYYPYLWEENCPFEPEEAYVGMSSMTGGAYSCWYYINVYGITHFLENTNGTPDEQAYYHNAMQMIGEESSLGIPITISSDREYNAWGGMIDVAHDALGTSNDPELMQELITRYSQESRAVGIHIALHPYTQEIGSWAGEDPEYIGTLAAAEIDALQVEDGLYACAKHFIARGGDNSYSGAIADSDAKTVDNWMTAWKLALDSNPEWLMTNGYSTGLYDGVHVDFDVETMTYLRETLGYEGVVLSDWGAQGADNASGITADGIDLSTFTIPERYAYTVNIGLDQIGSPASGENVENPGYTSDCAALYEAYEQGLVTEERIDETCRRVLRTKFTLGLFENPYVDAEYALSLAASDEYLAQAWEITDIATLNAARNTTDVELERQLEAESCVLVKNTDNLLPLAEGSKVYFDSTAAEYTKNEIIEALGAYAEVCEDIEEADIVIADCTQIDDAAELMVEDAQDYGKKLVVVTNHVDPDAWVVENADALLFMNFSRPADHGTAAAASITTTTEPSVYAELLFGVRQPSGMIVKEIARDADMDKAQWQDLAGDSGASDYVRMLLLAIMKTSDNNTTPENYGDPLLTYKYGMRYGESGEFVYDTLVLPKQIIETEGVDNSGNATVNSEQINGVTAGVPFNAYVLLWNNGSSDMTTVEAYDGDTLVASKIMAVNGGSWRVVELSITLDTPGEHTITVGDITKTITVQDAQ